MVLCAVMGKRKKQDASGEVTADTVTQVMREMGRKGGSVKGVKKGFATFSKRDRSQAGKAGAAARWGKKDKK
jgi:hypothetical protein